MPRPRVLVGTYGSEALAPAALLVARQRGAMLVVCFVRELALSYKYNPEEKRFTLETDGAAQKAFARFPELGHAAGVPVLPVYDSGANAAEVSRRKAIANGDRVTS